MLCNCKDPQKPLFGAMRFSTTSTFFACLLVCALSEKEVPVQSFDGKIFEWSYGASAEKTYMLTHTNWWESLDHQMTSIISLLTLAKNTSSIAIIPPLSTREGGKGKDRYLIGDFFDLSAINDVQPAMSLAEFMKTDDFKSLKKEKIGTVSLPKKSQEEYESKLGIFGKLMDTNVRLEMPPVDPENTNQKCNVFGGAMHVSSDGKRRFVFMDHIHFLHFCFEKFMPWWYDIRHRVAPRKPYFDVAGKMLVGKERPVSTIHISDVMEAQKNRGEEEIERYARQIVDNLRKNQAITGTLLLFYDGQGRNVKRVVKLLRQEFENVIDCSQVYCGEVIGKKYLHTGVSLKEQAKFFDAAVGPKMLMWALGTKSDLFIGNIHSPFSRNVCLYRKTHGSQYAILKGFGELRKVWSWNL